MKTGISKLDYLLDGGIKEKSSVLFCAEPGIPNEEFAQQLLFTNLEAGREGLYFVDNKSPFIIKKVLNEYGWSPEKYEKSNQLFFIDDFSGLFSHSSKEKFIISDPKNFNKIETLLINVLQKSKFLL